MFDYTGQKCPYCEIEFTKDDDVAVCPDCGTPHHRSCYSDHKACANEQKHAEGFDWQVAGTKKTVVKSSMIKCPSCGREIAAGSRFCNYCGASFEQPSVTSLPSAAQQNSSGDAYPPPPNFDYYGAGSRANSKKPTEFDGIPVADWLKYIGTGSAYYLAFFNMQDKTGRKTAFTFSAMLAAPLYFLYRKSWLFAALATIVTVILFAPYLIVLLAQNGLLSGIDIAFWETLSDYAFPLYLTVGTLWGMFAVYLYRRSSLKKIQRIKLKSTDEQEYQARLEKVSGPSTIAVAIPVFALLLVQIFFQ